MDVYTIVAVGVIIVLAGFVIKDYFAKFGKD